MYRTEDGGMICRRTSADHWARWQRQLHGLFDTAPGQKPVFPTDKLTSAPGFIVSQREVLKRLETTNHQVIIPKSHLFHTVLKFHDDCSFRTTCFNFDQEFKHFKSQMKRLNAVCSETHLPHEEFREFFLDCYGSALVSPKTPIRRWTIGDYIVISPTPTGSGRYASTRKVELQPKHHDVTLMSRSAMDGTGMLLTTFAEFGKLSTMIRGNWMERMTTMCDPQKQAKGACRLENLILIEPILEFMVPVMIEFCRTMAAIRSGLAINKPWKQPLHKRS